MYENLKRRGHGKQVNTIVNRFRFLNVWLRSLGIKMVKDLNARPDDAGLLPYDDAPKASAKKIDVYSPDEIKLLMDASTIDEGDMIQLFLKTGCRDGEVGHAKWSDIERKSGGGYEFVVQEKTEFGWQPKSGKTRRIDLSEKLYERLQARKTRQGESKHGLIFPNGNGEPDSHLISRLHTVWARVKAADGELSGRPELHRFRRTFITGLLAAGVPPQDVMNYSGHTDFKSFQRYMSVDTTLGRAGIEKLSRVFGD